MVLSESPALIVTTPNVFTNYMINNDIEGNKYGVAILNNTTIGIHCNQAMQTKRTGEKFDPQIPHEILNKGYECWGTSGIKITNLDLLHTVVVDYRTSIFLMRKFLSNELIWIFSKINIFHKRFQ